MDDEDVLTSLRDLLANLERGNSTQTRISALQNLSAFLEQQNEENDLLNDVHDEIVNGLRAQFKVANPLVTAKVLSVLPIITDRLTVRQDGHSLHRVRYVMQTLLAPLLSCLSDPRDRSREAAKIIVVQIAKAASAVTPLAATTANHSSFKSSHETPFALFERIVIESGLASKVAKVKEQVTLLLPTLRQTIEKFPLRPFLPLLVDHLSDADAHVREASRTTVISLFSNASPTAKSELKKEMEKKNTRKQTVEIILEQIFDANANVPYIEPVSEPDRGIRKPSSNISSHRFSTLNAALAAEEGGSGPSSRSVSRSASRMGGAGEAKDSDVRAVYIGSSHELERAFSGMVPHFEGKETEHNWQNREQDISKIRGMLKTSTYQSHPSAFAAGIRLLSEGILKAVASLRTTLSIHGITLISELAQQMGDDLEGQAEVFLTALIRMAGFTKKIVANASQATVGEIIKNVTYRHKYLELVAQGMQDKNFGTRVAMCQHLDTILNVHGKHRKHALEGHGGLNTITIICKKGLADPNKDVRALARNVFYRMEHIWPSVARNILDSLELSIQKQVESNRLPSGPPIPASPAPSRTTAPSMSAIASPRTPSNKIGPSSALLAAKKAAAASLAKERKEKAEREAQIQAEREMMTAQDDDEEDLMSSPSVGDLKDEELHSTPPLVIRRKFARSPSPSPVPAPPKSPLRSRVSSGSAKSAFIQPSSIPLPSSPVGNRSASRTGIARPANSVVGARSRTTSTSSISSNRSAGRFGASTSANYGSIAQRFDQQSDVLGTAPTARSTTNDYLPHTDLSADDLNRSVRVSTPSSPTRIPTRSPPRVLSPSALEKQRELDIADTSAMSFASTAHSGPDTSKIDHQLSSSPTNRSRLPRPVSMMYSSPPTLKAGLTSRHSHSLSTEASPSSPANEWNVGMTAKARSTQPPPSNNNENGTSPTHKEHGNGASAASTKQKSQPSTSTARSVIPPNATSAVKWFLSKADRFENATFQDEEPNFANLSPVKQRPESDGYIAQLINGSATLRTFKGLVSLSKEFKLPQKGSRPTQEDESPSLLGLDTDAAANREYGIAVVMWQEGHLFDRIFVALSKYLRSEDIITGSSKRDLQTAALVFLHRLVEFQFGLFTALDRERDLLDILLDLVKKNHSGPSAAGVKSACQAIADRWTDQTDVIIGVTTLRSLLSQFMNLDEDGQEVEESDDTSQSNVAVLTLTLRILARLFGRLPAELVEEQLERCKHVVRKGLKHRQIETRQQAVGVLVSANSKIRDPQSLFGILQPIDKAQQDLLIYYMNRT